MHEEAECDARDRRRPIHGAQEGRMLREFKLFLLRGNLAQLAVAFVIGLAFAALVTSLVQDVVTPLIGGIFGLPDFSELTFSIDESTVRYGEFLNVLVSFLIVATVVFFLVVRPVNALVERTRREGGLDPSVRACPECRSEIPVEARRCAFCTAEVPAGAPSS
jgi:large conductance mechanosensitive channel